MLLSEQRRFLLPAPWRVITISFFDVSNLAELMRGLQATAHVATAGLALAIAIGVTAAVLMSQGKWLESAFYPYAVLLQTVPILAVVPLIGLWLGYNFKARVFVCLLIALFPVITSTLFGLLSAERDLHDLFTLHIGARGLRARWIRLTKLQMPGALPAMFTGFRISAGLSVIGAIVGEFFFQQGFTGLGRLVDDYRARLQMEQLYAVVLCACVLGLAYFWLFGLLSRIVVGRWHQSQRGLGAD